MAEQDPQNTPEPTAKPEDGAPAPGESTDDIADAIARSEEAAESLGKDTEAGTPPAGLDAAAANALKAAQAAIAAAKSHQAGKPGLGASPAPSPGAAQPNVAELAAEAVSLPDFDPTASNGATSREIDLLADVNLNVTIELGRTRMLVEDVLRLGEGSVVELDKLAGDPVDVYVNGRHVARGEVLVVNDNFCVRVSEILSRTPGSDD
jgi:flagellar motor switch protein FliN/FliY